MPVLFYHIDDLQDLSFQLFQDSYKKNYFLFFILNAAILIAFACLPFVMHYLEHNPAKTCGISLLAALVLIAHRRNLMDEFLHLLEPREMKPKHNRSKL